MTFYLSGLLLTWLAILLLTLAVAGLVRQVRMLAINGMPLQIDVGAMPGLPDAPKAWLRDAKATLALFLDEHCKTCLDRYSDLVELLPESVTTVAAFERHAVLGEVPPQLVVLQDQHRLFSMYRIVSKPHGILFSRDGKAVASAALPSRAALKALLSFAVDREVMP